MRNGLWKRRQTRFLRMLGIFAVEQQKASAKVRLALCIQFSRGGWETAGKIW
jgi:hypothetical protein